MNNINKQILLNGISIDTLINLKIKDIIKLNIDFNRSCRRLKNNPEKIKENVNAETFKKEDIYKIGVIK